MGTRPIAILIMADLITIKYEKLYRTYPEIHIKIQGKTVVYYSNIDLPPSETKVYCNTLRKAKFKSIMQFILQFGHTTYKDKAWNCSIEGSDYWLLINRLNRKDHLTLDNLEKELLSEALS